MYVNLQRRALSAEYYAETVDHEFYPFRTYTTTVQFTRGRGFAERLKKQESPYLLERDEKGI